MRLSTVNILGVTVNSTRKTEVTNEIGGFVAKPRLKNTRTTPLIVFTPNPEFLVEAGKDAGFFELLNKADINLPDGIGLVWASRILGTPIQERVSGADVVGELLEVGNGKWEVGSGKLEREVGGGKGWTIGIAGARRGVQGEADELVKRLREKYPNITFVNLDIKSEILNPKSETKSNVRNSNDKNVSNFENCGFENCFEFRYSNFDIVFAAHGMKKQEQWIMANKDRLNTNVFMGVGGSLDFITGFTKRAPLIVRQVGMEWLWRGVQKPKHFLRIWQAVFVFGFMIMKEIIRNR